MPSAEVLQVIAGVSSFVGFCSLLAYLYFVLQLRKAETSVRQILEGDGIFNSSRQVVELLAQFGDDQQRLEALREITRYSGAQANALLEKVKGNVDLSRFGSAMALRRQHRLGITAGLFLVLAGMVLSYYWFFAEDRPSANGHLQVPVVTPPANASDPRHSPQGESASADSRIGDAIPSVRPDGSNQSTTPPASTQSPASNQPTPLSVNEQIPSSIPPATKPPETRESLVASLIDTRFELSRILSALAHKGYVTVGVCQQVKPGCPVQQSYSLAYSTRYPCVVDLHRSAEWDFARDESDTNYYELLRVDMTKVHISIDSDHQALVFASLEEPAVYHGVRRVPINQQFSFDQLTPDPAPSADGDFSFQFATSADLKRVTDALTKIGTECRKL